jgi:hypothetical protein
MQIIIYPNPLGKIVIVSPAPDADIAEVAAAVVPADTPHRIIDSDDLPPASDWLWSATGPIVVAPQESNPVPEVISFSQLVVGLVEQKWITPAEAEGWLSANSLPAAVEAAINTLPATAPDGSMPRLRARARALRPSEIHRSNQLLLLMASMRKATEADLDEFFRVYAAI